MVVALNICKVENTTYNNCGWLITLSTYKPAPILLNNYSNQCLGYCTSIQRMVTTGLYYNSTQ